MDVNNVSNVTNIRIYQSTQQAEVFVKFVFLEKVKEKRNCSNVNTESLILTIRDNNEVVNYKTVIKPKTVFQTGRRKITIIIEDISEDINEDRDDANGSECLIDRSKLLTISNCMYKKGYIDCKLMPTKDEIQNVLEDDEIILSIAEDSQISITEITSILTEAFL